MIGAAEADTPMVTRLRVALLGAKPAPWRRIEVLASTTLAGLHEVIQAAMTRVGGPAPPLLPHPRPTV